MPDRAFEDTSIKSVEVHEDGYTITREDGWCFGGVTRDMVRIAGAPEPREGMAIRFYGDGIGATVRGVMLDGVMLYYRTPEAQKRKHQLEAAAQDMRKEAELASSIVDRDARRAALPDVFQRRLAGFEQRNPTWRRDFEPYELSCCEDGARIAATLKTVERLEAFRKAEWQEQQKMVPGLFDGHSGNSFGMACRLARWMLTNPENVIHEHGAMCPLTGCRDYGCEQGVGAAPADGERA